MGVRGDTGRAGQSRRKVIEHPNTGRITLDCDVLLVPGDDVRITVHTAEPGSEDADKPGLVIFLGTQSLTDRADIARDAMD